MTGDPSREEMARKTAGRGHHGGRRARPLTVDQANGRAPRPDPRATRGISGPTTAPSEMPTRAAMAIPGNVLADGAPPGWNPHTGFSPPALGRWRTDNPTMVPATASAGTGHHDGSPWNPSQLGRQASVLSAAPARTPSTASGLGAESASRRRVLPRRRVCPQ